MSSWLHLAVPPECFVVVDTLTWYKYPGLAGTNVRFSLPGVRQLAQPRNLGPATETINHLRS